MALFALAIVDMQLSCCLHNVTGVIFGLIVIDNSHSPGTSRSVLGLFSVPAPFYPWALLFLWQVSLPGNTGSKCTVCQPAVSTSDHLL
jgi:hypothetical protein